MHYMTALYLRDTGKAGSKEIQVLPTGVEPMTFELLVQMLYHQATGNLWELIEAIKFHLLISFQYFISNQHKTENYAVRKQMQNLYLL